MLKTIRLSEIKPSTPRVRLQQSTEALETLANSIREEGLLSPVKVRRNGTGYTLVYGHRRVAAAKMAGLKEIDAIVADVPEDRLLTQALTENVVREDMAALDIAKALRSILDTTGCTHEVLAQKLGWVRQNVGNYLAMLEPELGLEKSAKGQSTGMETVMRVKAGTGGDLKLAAKVLKKAADDELSNRQVRRVAEYARKAQDQGGPAEVARVLALPSSTILAATEPRRTSSPAADRTVRVSPGEEWKNRRDVQDILAFVRAWDQELPKTIASIKAGKFSPEAKRFLGHKLRPTARRLTEFCDWLDR